ncbi:MAG: FG-GAP-like repeat-containing protein [Bacteroidia bacterium]
MKKNILLILWFIANVVGAQPVISSFAPTTGPVGSVVTITGSNFNTTTTNNIVFFGAVKATVISGTSTSLTVTVPQGATYQNISVTDITSNLIAYSAHPFIATFNCGGIIDSTSFTYALDSTVGANSRSVALGDLDGDGKSDMIVVNIISNDISVLKNTSTSGTISFSTKIDIPAGNQPFDVVTADIDGDAMLDILVAINSSQSKFSVYKNLSSNGLISFAPKVDFIAGAYARHIAVGDIDADGKVDVVVSNTNANVISVFKNTSISGSISFAPKIDYTTAANPEKIVIGDFNADGKPDLVVACSTAVTLSIFRNTSTLGAISLAPKVDMAMGYNNEFFSHLALGDLNADGKLDLAFTWGNSNYSKLSVLRNVSTAGAISFAPKVDFNLENGAGRVAISDLDGDAKLDLIVTSYGFSIFKNTSFNTLITFNNEVFFSFYSYFNSIALGDLDGDNKVDMSLTGSGNKVVVFKNQVNSPFMLSSSSASIFSGDTVVLPLSSNIPSNYVWQASNNPNTLGESTTAQSSTSINNTITNLSEYHQNVTYTVTPIAMSSGCVGTPQTVNVLVAFHSPTISAFSPSSGPIGTTVTITGTNFSSIPSNNVVFFGATIANVVSASENTLVVTVPYGATYQCISVANLTTHLIAYSDQPFVVTFPCPPGIHEDTFELKFDYGIGTELTNIDVCDFDLDGKVDIAIANHNVSNVSIMKNVSTVYDIIFDPKIDFATGVGPDQVIAGDMDGDGKPDLTVLNNYSNSISVLLNTTLGGNLSFAPKVDFPIGAIAKKVAIGDLNGDGKPELVMKKVGGLSVFQNTSTNGEVAFAFKINFSDNDLSDVALRDMNGDGHPEIVAIHNGHIWVYKNTSINGEISFDDRVLFEIFNDPYCMGIGDLDGDGKPDIVTGNMGNSTISILRNTSTLYSLSFVSQSVIVMPWNSEPYSISVGDVDGDGKLDIALANHHSFSYVNNKVFVYNNTSTVGNITFAPRLDYITADNPNCVLMTDFNGDTKPDLAVSCVNDQEISIFENIQCITADISDIGDREQSIAVSPNPFSLQTIVSFPNKSNRIIRIIDIYGKEVRLAQTAESQLIIEREELLAGIYFVQVINERELIHNEKLIIQ